MLNPSLERPLSASPDFHDCDPAIFYAETVSTSSAKRSRESHLQMLVDKEFRAFADSTRSIFPTRLNGSTLNVSSARANKILRGVLGAPSSFPFLKPSFSHSSAAVPLISSYSGGRFSRISITSSFPMARDAPIMYLMNIRTKSIAVFDSRGSTSPSLLCSKADAGLVLTSAGFHPTVSIIAYIPGLNQASPGMTVSVGRRYNRNHGSQSRPGP